LNYAVIPFILLDLDKSIEGWRRSHWYGHILIFGTLTFFWAGGSNFFKTRRTTLKRE